MERDVPISGSQKRLFKTLEEERAAVLEGPSPIDIAEFIDPKALAARNRFLESEVGRLKTRVQELENLLKLSNRPRLTGLPREVWVILKSLNGPDKKPVRSSELTVALNNQRKTVPMEERSSANYVKSTIKPNTVYRRLVELRQNGWVQRRVDSYGELWVAVEPKDSK